MRKAIFSLGSLLSGFLLLTLDGAYAQDSGTRLAATASATGVLCIDSADATVVVSATLTTTGSVDSALVGRSVDGGDMVGVGTINPQDFERSGRNKVASFADSVQLGNGDHTLTYCFLQSGAQGRLPKEACHSLPVTVSCVVPPTCGVPSIVIGNFVDNPHICRGTGPPHIPVHLRADASGDVTLTVSGPAEFFLAGTMQRAGEESCIYQFIWDSRRGNHGGAGDYTFTASDVSGVLLSSTEMLTCSP